MEAEVDAEVERLRLRTPDAPVESKLRHLARTWQPWILYVGGIWALVVAALAVRTSVADRRSG